MTLEQLFQDHKEFLLCKLIIASSNVTDTQWTKIRNCLSSNFKFYVTPNTFPGILGKDVAVIPAALPVLKNRAKSVELFVRYDFMNGQDAAVRDMLLTTKTVGWYDEFSSSISTKISHRFASPVNSTSITGVITVELPVNQSLLSKFKALYKYSVSSKTLSEYLTKLKEISNE